MGGWRRRRGWIRDRLTGVAGITAVALVLAVLGGVTLVRMSWAHAEEVELDSRNVARLALLSSAWPERTQKSYMDKYGGKIEDLGKYYADAGLFLAAPTYSGVKSIADLPSHAAELGGWLRQNPALEKHLTAG